MVIWSRGHPKFIHNKSRGMLLITPKYKGTWKMEAESASDLQWPQEEGCDPTTAVSASPGWANPTNVFWARRTGASRKVSCCLNAGYSGAVSNAKNLRFGRSWGDKAPWELLQKLHVGSLVVANWTTFWPENVICICLRHPKRLSVCLEIVGFSAA